MTGFSLVLDTKSQLGECPLWSVAEQVLYFVDIKGRAINRFDPATYAITTFSLPEEVGCIGLAQNGGFVAGLRSGIWLLDSSGQPTQMLAENPEDQATSRFNDGMVDPAGRFIAGTIDEARKGTASLYRYSRASLETLAENLMTSNGTAFSPDGKTFYHSDTPRFTVFAYGYDAKTGTLSDKRTFATLSPTETDRGRPDGAAVDVEGGYWTALFEGGRVQRYSPEGRLLAEYPVPAKCPTMPAFGGPDLKTLYLTTARSGRSEEELAQFPHSGSLFAMQVEVPGLTKPLFDLNA
jgi:sugar lactone lactonase YvrE